MLERDAERSVRKGCWIEHLTGMLDKLIVSDDELTVLQACWIQYWTGIPGFVFEWMRGLLFDRDAGLSGSHGCWMKYLIGQLDYLFYGVAKSSFPKG